MDCEGYNVVVTGGTRGIGRAISEAFLSRGARVAATYAGNDREAEAFASSCGDGRLKVYKSDVSDYAAAEEFFRRYDEDFGSLEVLVNNAGIRRDAVVGMMPVADWEAVLGVNLTGTYIMSKHAVMRMVRKRFGRIISITSPSGRIGIEGQANYAASKAGQVAFSRSLAREVGRRGITVNCVSPGYIDTELIADLPEDLRKTYKGQVPLGRFGTSAEVASAVMYLASREASYISGATLEVSGGL